jgi:hypothetical protein
LNKTSPAALLIGRLKNYCQSHNIPHIKWWKADTYHALSRPVIPSDCCWMQQELFIWIWHFHSNCSNWSIIGHCCWDWKHKNNNIKTALNSKYVSFLHMYAGKICTINLVSFLCSNFATFYFREPFPTPRLQAFNLPCCLILAHCWTTQTPRFWNVLATSPWGSATTSGIPVSPEAESCKHHQNCYFHSLI